MKKITSKSGCAVETTLSVIGGTWKPIILFRLLLGKMRFMQLAHSIPSVTQRMLTLQLRELECDGVILRTIYPEVPPRVEYELTELGFSLQPILEMMNDWGRNYQKINEVSNDKVDIT
ncbi:winged helix-turn-helix transcriptional regulator [Acinetobacter rudis]|uniref:winged helix-turn-helix transcriptional regulator n=1 Tax=Acinetobacter rudis TaxID=632955 RepID=UPI00333FB9E4